MNLSAAFWFVSVCFLFLNLSLCCYSLNDEGNTLLKLKERITSDPFDALSTWVDDEASLDPCHWFGVECADREVVVLNLKDLCLEGTLSPELMNLVHIKSIILRNNSFYGTIPEEIVGLKELEILDLGYNNFSGHLDANFEHSISSLAILLLDNNEHLAGFSPKINELKMLSECQVDENQLTNAANMASCSERSIKWHVHENEGPRSLLEHHKLHRPPYHYHRNHTSPLYRPSPSHSPSVAAPPPVPSLDSPDQNASDSPNQNALDSPDQNASDSPPQSIASKKNQVPIFAGVIIGSAVFLVISTIGIYLCKTNKVSIVKPWTTGISGQLQKALVTGVPKLKRIDLEAACEDFSNVIGNSPIGTLYKGTLSSGVEIAVASVSMTLSKTWTKNLEAQFRKKIDILSKVNHRNFVNLIGYCEEEEPFTRMLVFEYAPNGTLFEHLHVKEAEHLNWGPRLRIATGMAYCLQYMHGLDPPVALINLSSSTVHLTDDHAAKISDLSFSHEKDSSEKKPDGRKDIDIDMMDSTSRASNVYSFGVLLFEIVTGRIPYSVDNSSAENWASHYLKWDKPLEEMVDATLASYQENQVEQVAELIKDCVDPDSEKRPRMNEVSERLREITKMSPEFVVPKLSPLWWAELEISSA
ncbi:probable inactive receptor-like protein kinase At3g56050 [Lathyrus oleraceus]|uniref:Protein kinase domain-containing protein n=1 Tax=Pisum sativum TaxID=3888 RepID=A0A9D4Y788_PEA|nr:probable inactive receptor-like protein kinase At3g56050 [Pisum sativum]KAI5434042.1 hypothetical protein KIW84_021052 [Pisum sativum]